jgi:hypothetical protein
MIKLPDLSKAIAVDTESTTNGYDGSPKASYRTNKLLTIQGVYLERGKYSQVTDIYEYYNRKVLSLYTLVAHNLQFDMGYFMRDRPDIPWHTLNMWCTAVEEYLISGHKNTYPSLNMESHTQKVLMLKLG